MSRALEGDAKKEQVWKERVKARLWPSSPLGYPASFFPKYCRVSSHVCTAFCDSQNVFICIFSLEPQYNLVGWCYLPHSTDEKIEAQRGQVISSSLQSQLSGRPETSFKYCDPPSPVLLPFLNKENHCLIVTINSSHSQRERGLGRDTNMAGTLSI